MARESDLEQELAEIAALTERLRVHFNAYFLGLEKNAPSNLRDQLERRIRTSPLNDETKAFYKFRFQSAVSRYRTMSVYWDRTLRDLETGRTTRAKLRAEKGYGSANVGDIETPRMRRVRQAAEKSSQMDSGQAVENLFNEFVEARKSVGLPVEGLSKEVFEKTLDRQREVHTSKPEIKDVEFSIKVKEGRVVVVARPVKE